MGDVYEALHEGLKKKVALKTLRRMYINNSVAVSRFLREGQAAARVRHPSVVDIHDVGTEQGMPFLAMEFLEGEDLGQLLDRTGRLSAQRTVDTLLPILAALSVAHEEGVIHRDIKPENIFLARVQNRVEPKILDFGISKILDDQAQLQLTQTQTIVGTPLYMSPEQTRGAKYATALSDQYAMGVVLYECLTGRAPFEAESFLELIHEIADAKYPPPHELCPELPSNLNSCVLRAMAKKPSDRFESVRDLGFALLPHAGDRARLLFEDGFRDRLDFPAYADTEHGAGPRAISQIVTTTPDSTPQAPAAVLEPPPSTSLADTTPRASGRRVLPGWRLPALVLSGLAVVGVGIVLAFQSPSPPPTVRRFEDRAAVNAEPAESHAGRYEVTLRSVPEATLTLDDGPAVEGELHIWLPLDGVVHHVSASADGYEAETISFRDEAPAPMLELRRVQGAAPARAAPEVPDQAHAREDTSAHMQPTPTRTDRAPNNATPNHGMRGNTRRTTMRPRTPRVGANMAPIIPL